MTGGLAHDQSDLTQDRPDRRTSHRGRRRIGRPRGSRTHVRALRTPGSRTLVDNRFWHTYTDWRWGSGDGTRVLAGTRPGLAIATPAGRTDYTDPHTGETAAWEYATWTSPLHRSAVPATELITSWNARTPAGTWIAVELSATYADGTATPGS